MPGLSDSRWANEGRASSVPPPIARTSSVAGEEHGNRAIGDIDIVTSAAAELSRYAKIVRRMKWKLPFLETAYELATGSNSMPEAELMFKLDFFEYYMLCERALVHLQGVFGIVISREFADAATAAARGVNKSGRTSMADVSRHRYHANVLQALDREDNPLHEILGVGAVRSQLARAKDLRNRWKNADAGTQTPGQAHRGGKMTAPLPLETYNLGKILTTVHQGLDDAYAVADRFVAEQKKAMRPDQTGMPTQNGGDKSRVLQSMDIDLDTTQEVEWSFMMEAMDWEAV